MSLDPSESRDVTRIAVAVVTHQARVLVGRRPLHVPLPGYAEFPGGKVEAGESLRDAAVRECLEETGLRITIDQELDEVYQAYEHGDLEIHFFHATVLGATLARAPFEWVPLQRLKAYRFPPANESILPKLRQYMER